MRTPPVASSSTPDASSIGWKAIAVTRSGSTGMCTWTPSARAITSSGGRAPEPSSGEGTGDASGPVGVVRAAAHEPEHEREHGDDHDGDGRGDERTTVAP